MSDFSNKALAACEYTRALGNTRELVDMARLESNALLVFPSHCMGTERIRIDRVLEGRIITVERLPERLFGNPRPLLFDNAVIYTLAEEIRCLEVDRVKLARECAELRARLKHAEERLAR